MTNREFIQSKFDLVILTGVTVFFTLINLLLLVLAVYHPGNDIITGMADWFLKGAIGPLVGALISTLITPHATQRRADSENKDTTSHTSITTDITEKPKLVVEPLPTDPAATNPKKDT